MIEIYVQIFFLGVLLVVNVNAQTPGTDFICVAPGTCVTNTTGGNVIDPRIVTPVSF